MRRHLFLFFSIFIVATTITAQPGGDFYRSKNNPYYWGNRKPNAAYWQQDVYYNIKATIDEKSDILSGTEELTYWNNSPEELTCVYFNLYENAYQPGSYYDNLSNETNRINTYGNYESQKLGITIDSISSGNTGLKTEFNNTVVKVFLEKPLKSGDSITFKINFKTYFDILTSWRRMKVFNVYGYKHYNGAQWYPRICVYDRVFGWVTDQHLGHEFYGDFGAFDVKLNFANNFIIEATGILQNKEEVLPEELRQKLDIKNYKDKPLFEKPSVIIPYDSSIRKIWKYHADNVHDFAFVADPTFRIGTAFWNGIECVAVAMEPDASKWQNAATLTAQIVQMYSEKIGMYCYPKIVTADALSGMEYPMLTMDSGLDPEYTYVLAHEIGHNWFFGQVGNNETYRASLDEGFTQYLTTWALDSLSKIQIIDDPIKSTYLKKFSKIYPATERACFLPYYENAMKTEGVQLNTHSDAFYTTQAYGNVYRQVYYKAASMLYNLQYVLGDSLFTGAMNYYFNTWKFAHPYFEDFRSSIMTYTKCDLNWFFDEWLETNKTIDYKVKGFRKGELKDQYIISFKRKGRMQMPLDISITDKNDSIYTFYIPNTYFIKPTKSTVLPKWFGWDFLNPVYKATVTIPSGISNIVIDPSGNMSDMNMLNNSLKFPLSFEFDSKVPNLPNRKKYEVFAGPDIWWNGYDGLKLGLNLNGSYFNYKNKFDATLWMNTGFLQKDFSKEVEINKFDNLSYRISYTTPLGKFFPNSNLSLLARNLDGVQLYKAELDKKNYKQNLRFYLNFKTTFLDDSTDLNYLLYPAEWGISTQKDKIRFNNSINLGIDYTYNSKGFAGKANVNLRSSAFGSFYDFSLITLNNVTNKKIGKLVFKLREFFQYGFGTSISPESSLFLAGGNPEDLIENKFTRSAGIIDNTWLGYGNNTNHFQYGGGLNLRGYAGYLMPIEGSNNTILYAYKGISGAAMNAELEFDKLVRFKPPVLSDIFGINSYFFSDIGTISYNNIHEPLKFIDYRADAGIGFAFTIKKWGPLSKLKPLTFRFDLPLFLNRIPYLENEYVKFRWIMSVGRAF
jgi:hypothetical protein